MSSDAARSETMGPDAPGQFRLIACPSILHERRSDTYCEAGRTIGDYLQALGWKTDGLHARVSIDGELVPDAEWLTAEPKAGQSVVVRRVLTGGGGQNTGKQIVQLVGMLVIMAAAYATGQGYLASLLPTALQMAMGVGGGVGWQVAGAVIGIGGSLALHARIPPPLPRRVPLPLPTRTLSEAA